MKITPDNLSRLKEAAKILSSLPFMVEIDTIPGKPTVQLFLERKEFEENFPSLTVAPEDYGTFLIAEQDGVNFLCYEPKGKDHD